MESGTRAIHSLQRVEPRRSFSRFEAGCNVVPLQTSGRMRCPAVGGITNVTEGGVAGTPRPSGRRASGVAAWKIDIHLQASL